LERTLVLIKPDGVQRGLIGEIIGRFERRGLRLVGMKFMQMGRGVAEQHYAEHKGKPFYDGLVDYITSGPIVAMVWESSSAIQIVRDMMGKTKPVESPLGTIRGDFSIEVGRNLVHGSDSPDSAKREVALFFPEAEQVDWKRTVDQWVFES
jgi:nucleoside-diphosphate kinase